jgi:uncharacterized protein with NRDE domain
MCLVAIAWRAHPRYPLIVAGNRDEFHGRPSAPAAWWEDAPVFGGRDLVAGGSWLAMSRAGRFAVVTNTPGRPPPPADSAVSRGHLVREFVASGRPANRYLDAVSVAESRYAGFSLVVGTIAALRGYASSDASIRRRWTLARGVTVITNSAPGVVWPKASDLEERMRQALAGDGIGADPLLALLGRREPVAGEGSAVSRTPFVVGAEYGTRASTVILVDDAGSCHFTERRFGPGGEPAGDSEERFGLQPP